MGIYKYLLMFADSWPLWLILLILSVGIRPLLMWVFRGIG